jgi:hypothetical protein
LLSEPEEANIWIMKMSDDSKPKEVSSSRIRFDEQNILNLYRKINLGNDLNHKVIDFFTMLGEPKEADIWRLKIQVDED